MHYFPQRPGNGTLAGLVSSSIPPIAWESLGPNTPAAIAARCYDGAIVQTLCYRSISKRALTFARRYCVDVAVAGGVDAIAAILAALGITPGAGGGLRLFDGNNEAERSQLNKMVWPATRVWCCASVLVSDSPDPDGAEGAMAWIVPLRGLEEQICCLLLSQLGFRIFNSSDRADPLIDFTPLDYWSRPGLPYIPQPALMFIDRNPVTFLESRGAFNTGLICGLQMPAGEAVTYQINLELVIETLWLPNPALCGPNWPGQLCPQDFIIDASKPELWRARHIKEEL